MSKQDDTVDWSLSEPDAGLLAQAALASNRVRDAISGCEDAPREWLVGSLKHLAMVLDIANAANHQLVRKARCAILLGQSSYNVLAHDPLGMATPLASLLGADDE